MGFGFVLAATWLPRPIVGWGRVPTTLSRQFASRRNQIIAGESCGALSPIYTCPSLFYQQDFVHFIDNLSSLAMLISGTAAAEDLGAFASLYQILATKLDSRAWLEFVESSANLADGPSRLGPQWRFSELARRLNAVVIDARMPELPDLLSAPLSSLVEAFAC